MGKTRNWAGRCIGPPRLRILFQIRFSADTSFQSSLRLSDARRRAATATRFDRAQLHARSRRESFKCILGCFGRQAKSSLYTTHKAQQRTGRRVQESATQSRAKPLVASRRPHSWGGTMELVRTRPHSLDGITTHPISYDQRKGLFSYNQYAATAKSLTSPSAAPPCGRLARS